MLVCIVSVYPLPLTSIDPVGTVESTHDEKYPVNDGTHHDPNFVKR
jgi:hypothetical protein